MNVLNLLDKADRIHRTWCEDGASECLRCAKIEDDIKFFERITEDKKTRAYLKKIKHNSKTGIGIWI